MGLDMSLYRSNILDFPITIHNKTELSELSYKAYDIEIAYWRYGTPIHEFFENKIGRTIENCEYVKIEKEWLEELYNICCDILDRCALVTKDKIMNDIEYCEKMLPVSDKFNKNFCQYDEWYYNTLYRTKFKLEEVLDTVRFDVEDVFYSANW